MVRQSEQVGVIVIPALYEMCPIPSAIELKEFLRLHYCPEQGLGSSRRNQGLYLNNDT